MKPEDFRASMVRLRADAVLQRDLIHELVLALDKVIGMPAIGSGAATAAVPAAPAVEDRTPVPRREKGTQRAKRPTNAVPSKPGMAILAALKAEGHPIAPGKLASLVKLEPGAVSYHTQRLVHAGLVKATGRTNSRRLSLAP